MKILFGIQAMIVLSNCGITSKKLDVELCPPVVFFSALDLLDRHRAIMTEKKRAAALGASVRHLLANIDGSFPTVELLIRNLIERVYEGYIDFIKPIDLLEAAFLDKADDIDAGLRSIGFSSEEVLATVRQLPPECLSDRLPLMD